MVKHEEGLLYVCHLMGPLLQRLHIEKPRVLMDIVAQVYLLVQSVDKHLEGHLQHSDVVCDFLYPSIMWPTIVLVLGTRLNRPGHISGGTVKIYII